MWWVWSGWVWQGIFLKKQYLKRGQTWEETKMAYVVRWKGRPYHCDLPMKYSRSGGCLIPTGESDNVHRTKHGAMSLVKYLKRVKAKKISMNEE